VNTRLTLILVLAALLAPTAVATAQPLGTFRWQLQPYCNVLTVTVTQIGSLYRVEGRDDRCGATRAGSVIGTAFLNPDGTVGMGLNIVSVPDGRPEPVAAVLSLATLNGTWSGAATAGQFVFTPGAGIGGPSRPAPAGVTIPAVFSLNTDGAFLAGGTIQQGNIPASGPGVRLMWHPRKAALRAGSVGGSTWDDANVGESSAAFNANTRASGPFSVAFNSSTVASGSGSLAAGSSTTASGSWSSAFGLSTTASGSRSIAAGSSTIASGQDAVAMGEGTKAIGPRSMALGLNSSATGNQSLAIGNGVIASGVNSVATGFGSFANGNDAVAMGGGAVAAGHGSVALGNRAFAQGNGSFVFADLSSSEYFTSFIPNQFIVKAAGGVGFYTNAAATVGVELGIGGSQWLSVSDVNAKQAFRDLDGEEVLAKLARMPIQEWSYKAQDDAIRHVGPTAQDFKAAFGLGEDDLRIGTLDADGIALRAVQALELRTRELAERDAERDRLSEHVATLTKRLTSLEQELARVKTSGRQ
jgi:hypothetical protein